MSLHARTGNSAPAARGSASVGDAAVIVVGISVVLALGLAVLMKYTIVQTQSVPARLPIESPLPMPAAPQVPVDTSIDAQVAIFGQVEELRLTPLAKIPNNPTDISQRTTCRGGVTTGLTDYGMAAVAAGWQVLSETTVSKYQVVVVESRSRWEKSRGCIGEGTSVLIFDADTLIAVAYDKRKVQSDSSMTLVQQSSESRLRLSAINGALADLDLTPDAIHLRPLPPFDSFCNSRVRVPRLERRDYLDARLKLLAEGWIGSSSTENPSVELQSIVAEVGECNVVGECRAGFTHVSGDALTVITQDIPRDLNSDGVIDPTEFPTVIDSTIVCRGGIAEG